MTTNACETIQPDRVETDIDHTAVLIRAVTQDLATTTDPRAHYLDLFSRLANPITQQGYA